MTDGGHLLDESLSVSVVVPTIGRPELREAVESALAQTMFLREVIVAADTDGPLDLPPDPRVHVIRTGPRAGGNVARMAGIRRASSPIIALLDDDDVWEPHKLERQLQEVRRVAPTSPDWLSVSLVEEASGRVWPERLIGRDESLPVYLFRKTRVKGGQGALHTSTMVFPRQLALNYPFDETLRFHQDTDWLVRLDRDLPALEVIQVADPLVRLGHGAGSVSRGIQPERSLEWALRSMSETDRTARGDFLLTVTYFQAVRHRDIGAALRVVWSAVTWGRPTPFAYASIVTIPAKLIVARGRL